MRLQHDKLLLCQICFPTILIYVFLSITVTETILSQEDMPWEVLKRRGHESVRLMELTRFYLELHKDPHGPEVAMFIGNLPANLSQKQYETLLMEFLDEGACPIIYLKFNNRVNTLLIMYCKYLILATLR